MLQINNLTKTFKNLKAVDNLSLKIKAGTFFSLIGPNGSGKTTIIKTVLGLLKATEGNILIDGLDVTDSPIETKSKMAYVPDDPQAWSHITGEEFLYFMAALYGLPVKETD